uniref:Uncharacterized protein n=1 Tax=Erythrolobus madagascarensis TaxID=708628 RepID=A0A7S0XKF7_9RHOD|mmetsp:Transcript_754/g.1448  ORF Transcript_754/g.1448 Transcript_754/m.1448 type:complete len:210 (+) Transcript_754:188-817(+)
MSASGGAGNGSGGSSGFVKDVYLRVIESTVEAARSELEQEGTDAAVVAALDELRTRWQRSLLASQDFDEHQRIQDVALQARQEEMLHQRQLAVASKSSPPARQRKQLQPQHPQSQPLPGPASLGARAQNQQPVVLPGIASFAPAGNAAPRHFVPPQPNQQTPAPVQLPHISELGPRAGAPKQNQPQQQQPQTLPSIGSFDPRAQPAPRQ